MQENQGNEFKEMERGVTTDTVESKPIFIKNDDERNRELKTYDEGYWEGIISILFLFFATYTVMKDLIVNPESTTKAFTLAVLFDFIIVLLFWLWWRMHGKKS